ncbi:MAG: preprotein translocase subunit YajC [Syntrophothermus sp.]
MLTLLTAAAQPASTQSLTQLFLPFIIMLAIFYFILWRPQSQQQKKRKQMLSELKKGDRIVTVGGIHGEITGLKDEVVTVRIADKVEVKLSKSAVGQVLGN